MKKILNFLFDILFYLVAGTLLAVAVDCFMAPNELVLGGATGMATIVGRVFGLPIGMLILGINLPLFYLGYRYLGRGFLPKTVVATVISSVTIDLLQPFLPTFQGDRLLAALYGGVLTGIAIALVFARGATTGGVDIVARLVNQSKPHMSLGRVVLLVDAVVVLLGAVIFRDTEAALYSAIAIYVDAKAIDSILYGFNRARFVMIVSEQIEAIRAAINDRMERGATLLDGRGAYTGRQKSVLICAVRSNEVTKLRRIIRETDSEAFTIIGEANEVLGEGFLRG